MHRNEQKRTVRRRVRNNMNRLQQPAGERERKKIYISVRIPKVPVCARKSRTLSCRRFRVRQRTQKVSTHATVYYNSKKKHYQ